MTLELPCPIAAYVAANARLDVDGMLSPFSREAVLFADGGRHEGYAGMRALFEEAVIPVKGSRGSPMRGLKTVEGGRKDHSS